MPQDAIAAAIGSHAVATTPHASGGEDFGWYIQQVPGSYARLGVWSGEGAQCDLHQPTFHLDERALAVGIRTMVHVVLTALTTTG
jgi:metal-dependent amidase/aminoacylase/carboxypeptidase family protein